MILFEKIIRKHLKDTNGFTLMELMVVVALIGILTSFAVYSYLPARAKALDANAIADARNLVASVVNATMNKEDVDYTKVNTGGAVGDKDTAGNNRKPIFVLSNGVAAVIVGDSIQAPNGNTTIFSAIIYHTGGTTDPFSMSGKKEYTCSVDEEAGTSIVPDY